MSLQVRRVRLTEQINQLPKDYHFTIAQAIFNEQPNVKKTRQPTGLMIDSKFLNETTIEILEEMIKNYNNNKKMEEKRKDMEKMSYSDGSF